MSEACQHTTYGRGTGPSTGWEEPIEVPDGHQAQPASELGPKELGRRGEDVAAANLRKRGWAIIGRNWRSAYGEVDIVALEDPDDEGAVVLVEVKTRLATHCAEPPMPELAVDAEKRRRYRTLALAYLLANPGVRTVRFDVIALSVTSDDRASLRHIPNAFAWDS